MNLLAELKRRRVFRVAGAYLVAAWVVLQVADVIFPALGLPAWSLTLIVVLVILGFPIALVLGWAFDITPGGIERTPDGPIRMTFPLRAAAIGTLVVAVGVVGFVGVRRHVASADLDANAIAILPFRVLGDADLMVMREGMVDLLSAKLTGEGGARAIDSRTTLALWRKSVDSEADDLAPREALQLARKLGAGTVLLGEMVGTANEIIVNVKLYSAVHGAVVESVEEKASPDDVMALVDRVVTRLLSARAGEAHRASALLSESLPAVRAYLDGTRLYRQGRQDSAAAHFRSAVEQDSTFALAGLYLALARGWTGYGPEYVLGRRLAWENRERLPRRDRDLVAAWLGDDFPLAPSPVAEVANFERLTAQYPDMVEAWYALGDAYFHRGAPAGIAQPIDKAMHAWSRALALDSTYAPALEHHLIVYALAGDTANVRRVSALLYERLAPDERLTGSGAYTAALALNDSAWRQAWLDNLDNVDRHNARAAALNVTVGLLPQQDYARLAEHGYRKSTRAQQLSTALWNAVMMINVGNVSEALKWLTTDSENAAPTIAFFALSYPEFGRTLEEQAIRTVEAKLRTDSNSILSICTLASWRAAHGEDQGIKAARAALQKDIEARPDQGASWVGPCLYSIEILAALDGEPARLRRAVAHADSVLLHTPVAGNWREYLTQVTLQGYRALGEDRKALEVSRRLGTDVVWARSTLMLERARLAAKLGEREEAVQVYRDYLKLRGSVEKGTGAEQLVQQARNELAALVGER